MHVTGNNIECHLLYVATNMQSLQPISHIAQAVISISVDVLCNTQSVPVQSHLIYRSCILYAVICGVSCCAPSELLFRLCCYIWSYQFHPFLFFIFSWSLSFFSILFHFHTLLYSPVNFLASPLASPLLIPHQRSDPDKDHRQGSSSDFVWFVLWFPLLITCQRSISSVSLLSMTVNIIVATS